VLASPDEPTRQNDQRPRVVCLRVARPFLRSRLSYRRLP